MTQPTETGQLANVLLGILEAADPGEAHAQAREMLAAATALLQDRFGTDAALGTLANFADAVRIRGQWSSPSTPAIPPAPVSPAELAGAVLGQLRAMPQDDGHERSRAVVAGAAAYLHETHGASYASAILDGVLTAAACHGAAIRCERPDGVAMH